VLSNADREHAGVLRLANNTDKEFVGTVRVRVPEGFSVTPAETPVRVKPDERIPIQFKVAVVKQGRPKTDHVVVELVGRDGRVETTQTVKFEYLGPRRTVIEASEDTYVNAGLPTVNFGHSTTLLVDGGDAKFGDHSHNLAYLKFPLKVPGRIVSVKLRLHTSPSEGSESGNSGEIRLVEAPWDEYKLTFNNRPKPGAVIGTLGRVNRDAWEERSLTVDLTGKHELSLLLNPTTNDGANYFAREGGRAPQLVVESVVD